VRRLLALHTMSGRMSLLALGVIAGWLALIFGLLKIALNSADLGPYDNAEDWALRIAAGFGGLIALGAYPVLRLATSRALRPVERMTRQAAEWSAHASSERFGDEPRLAELQSLAGTLDGVLDRYSALLRHERRLPGELSHELRTPLATLRAEADLLVSHPDATVAAAAARMQEQAARMDRILDTLLATARAELTTTPGTCRLSEVLAELPTTAHRDGPDVIVGVDSAVLERILAPILANAERYARSRICVTPRSAGRQVHIDVANDGPPLPGDPDSLFEPGYRDEGAGHDGAGLGLALARRLARAAEGDVTAVAADPPTFRITLPAG